MKKTYSAPSLTTIEMGAMTPVATSFTDGVQVQEDESLNPNQTFSVSSPWQPVDTGSEEDDL